MREAIVAQVFWQVTICANDRQMVPLAHLLQLLTKGGFCAEELSSLLGLQSPMGIRRVKQERERSGRWYGVMHLIR